MIYRPEIDGLRALAVIPVVFFHAGISLFSGGYVGVDVFFVISGYLITSIILNEIEHDRFSLTNFYERRARRILPALFFVMLVSIPFSIFLLTPDNLKDYGQSLISVSVFSSNILFWQETGYFNTASELKPLIHTWSLAIEEQFYILFPLFLIVFWKYGIKVISIVLLIVFLLSISVAHWGAFNKPAATFFLLPTRGWELLLGVFIAIFLKFKTHINGRLINEILSLIGICLIIFAIINFDENTPFPSLYTLIPTIGTALIILSTSNQTILYKFLSYKPFVGIGLISYSVYLWHQPVLAFARHRLVEEPSTQIILILILISFLIGYISWKIVEKPFRNKTKINRESIFKYSLLGMAFFIIIGTILNAKYKNIADLNPLIKSEKIHLLSEELKLRDDITKSGLCWFNKKDGITDIQTFIQKWNCIPEDIEGDEIFVYGDSTSADVAAGLRAKNIRVIQLGGAGCGLIYSNEYKYPEYCKEIDELAKKILNENNFKNVLLSMRFNHNELKDEYIDLVINKWGHLNKSVYILEPPIIFPFYKAHFYRFHKETLANKFDIDDAIDFKKIITKKNLPDTFKVINTFNEECKSDVDLISNRENCIIYKFYDPLLDQYIRIDDVHLSKIGAEMFANKLLFELNL
tara:strand:- start:1819 stop:3729 length:1911 start_codon:yes stop_codon:yes gene_type:complete